MMTGLLQHQLQRRRFLAASGAGMLPFVLLRSTAVPVHASSWSPEDGLRLAGPVAGLETLDPALSRDMQTNSIVRQVSRGLMGYDEDLLPIPEVAGHVDVSPDQAEYTFSLRETARFHDGRRIEAADVAWSFARALHPDTSAAAGLPLAGTTFLGDIAGAEDVRAGAGDVLTGVEILDDRTVRITLREPSTTFLMRLAAVPAMILDRHQDTPRPGWWTAINGSGPYRVHALDPETELQLRAVESWMGSEIPVKDVRIRLGISASAPENLLQNGDIDLLDDVFAPMVPLLSDPATGLDGYQAYETPLFALAYVAFGGREAPLDDIHVRRAIQLGFDVEAYIEAALGDLVMVPEGLIPMGVLGRAWRIDMPGPDVEAAREELSRSRYGSAAAVPTIRIHAADIGPVETMRDVLWRDLGLEIDAVQVNWSDFLSGLSEQRWDAYSVFWGMDYPDPEALLGMLWESGSADNYTGYRNPGFDTLLEESRRAADDIVRQEIYMEAQQMLIDDVAVIPLYVPRRFTFARAGFEHVPVTSIGLLGLERVR
jgi:oligopeptide transport system substrate-binding protein